VSARLIDTARVIRSKNSGPFELTLDILFRDRRDFDRLQQGGFFSRALVSRLYGVSDDEISGIIYFEPAQAVKITLRRRIVSGTPGDTDIYGAQQHAPLLELEVPT
jgi:hypothetical protein